MCFQTVTFTHSDPESQRKGWGKGTTVWNHSVTGASRDVWTRRQTPTNQQIGMFHGLKVVALALVRWTPLCSIFFLNKNTRKNFAFVCNSKGKVSLGKGCQISLRNSNNCIGQVPEDSSHSGVRGIGWSLVKTINSLTEMYGNASQCGTSRPSCRSRSYPSLSVSELRCVKVKDPWASRKKYVQGVRGKYPWSNTSLNRSR